MRNQIITLLSTAALFWPITSHAETSDDSDTVVLLTNEVVILPPFAANEDNHPAFVRDPSAEARELPVLPLPDFGSIDLRDALWGEPSVQLPSRWGAPTVPDLRGDPAQLLRNGQRSLASAFTPLPVLASVDSIEILPGASPIKIGPSGGGGGSINLITSLPRAESEFHLNLSLPEGGGSDTLAFSATVDQSMNFDQFGERQIRVVAFAEEDPTWLESRGGKRDARHLSLSFVDRYGAWDIWLNGGYTDQDVPQLLGVNRPTQTLIDDLLYTAGKVADPSAPVFGQTIAVTGLIPLEREDVLLSPGDEGESESVWIQAIAERSLADGTLTSQTLFETRDEHRYHGFEYAEDFEGTLLDQRLTWKRTFQDGTVEHHLQVGLNLRYEERKSLVNYFNELFFAFDVTDNNLVHDVRVDFPTSSLPGRMGPEGRSFFGASEGSPESADGDLWTLGGFAEWTVDFGALSLTAGGNGSWIDASAQDAFPVPGQPILEDDLSTDLWQSVVTLAYETEGIDTFLTVQRGENINGSTVGGGFLLYPTGLDPDDFSNRTDLIEFGFTGSLVFEGSPNDGRRGLTGPGDYADWRLAFYHQERNRTEIRSGRNQIEVQGVELSLDYRWWFTFGRFTASYQDGRYVNTGPFELGGANPYDIFAAGEGPDGLGTGVGYQAFAPGVGVGDYRLPGMSRWVFALREELELSDNWSLFIGAWLQSPQRINLAGTLELPWQHEVDFGVRWKPGKWTIDLQVRNLTDEWNWVHNGGTFANNQLLGTNRPRTWSLTVGRTF